MFEWRFFLLPQLSYSSNSVQTPTLVGLQDMRLGWHPLCGTHCAEMSWDSQLLAHMAEASLHRHESRLGVRCDEQAFCIFLSVRLSRGFELVPYQKWNELWPTHFPCRHMYVCAFFCLELVLWRIPPREKSYSVLCQWTKQPQTMLGSLHVWCDSLSISTLSTYWWFLCVVKLLSGRLPCTALEMATFFSTLHTYLSDFLCRPIKNWNVLKHERKFYSTVLKTVPASFVLDKQEDIFWKTVMDALYAVYIYQRTTFFIQYEIFSSWQARTHS